MRSSLKPNIHIIDRVLYIVILHHGISEPHNWTLTLEMIQGNRRNIFKLILYFFQALSTYFVHLFYNMYELYENIYVEIMIMPRVKRRPILFWNK